MRVTIKHRKKLEAYLHRFYEYYPQEKFTIFHFVKNFKARMKNNRDTWMAVSGDTGTGKSLFVLMTQILYGKKFDLTKNVCYIPKGDEIVKKFQSLPKRSTLLIDESAKEMRAVNWQSKAQQSVNVTAMTDRFKEHWVFMNIPNFQELTKSMKRTSIQFRAILPYRTGNYARVIIQRKSRDWRSPDPWCDKQASDIYTKLQSKKKELTNDTILSIERSMPNYVMDFIVPNLELVLPEVTAEYEKLKMDSRDVDGNVVTDRVDIHKSKVKKLQQEFDETMAKVVRVLWYNELDIGKVRVRKSDILKSLGITQSQWQRYMKMPRTK